MPTLDALRARIVQELVNLQADLAQHEQRVAALTGRVAQVQAELAELDAYITSRG
jgi:hypothetical protein